MELSDRWPLSSSGWLVGRPSRHSRSRAGRGPAKRELEGAQEIVEFQLPAVLTVDEGLNTARYPSLKGIMAAKKKPLQVKSAQLPPPQVTVRKLELPAE